MSYVDASVFARLVEEVQDLRDRVDRQARSPQESGVVTAVDLVANRVTVDVGGSTVIPDLPPGGVYLPRVGETVTVWYSGAAVIVLPQGSSLISSHNFNPLDPTADGWGLDANGNLWANDGHFRGTVEATSMLASYLGNAAAAIVLPNGDVETVAAGTELLSNGTFDTNTVGWSSPDGSATLARITAAPTPQAGAGALSLTRIGTPVEMSGFTTTGTGGIPCTMTAGTYKFTGYVRSASTGRSAKLRAKFYKADGTYLTGKDLDSQTPVTDSSGAWTPITFRFTPPPLAAFFAVGPVFGGTPAEVHYFDTGSTTLEVVGIFVRDLVTPTLITGGSVISGTRSLSLSAGAGAFAGAGYKVPVEPLTGYTIEIDAKVTTYNADTRWWLVSYFRDAAGVSISYSDPDDFDPEIVDGFMATTVTTARASRFAPAGAAYMEFELWFTGAAGAQPVILDNFRLRNVTAIDGGYVDADMLRSRTYVYDRTGLVAFAGEVRAFAGDFTNFPVGWKFCDGAAISRTTYARLFSVLGTRYGAGDGSTTFNVPDLKGRVIVGLDNMGGSDAGRLTVANTLGGTGGEEKHVLTTAELAAHVHSIYNAYRSTGAGALGANLFGGTDQIVADAVMGLDQAHNNMQPYMLLNYLIKT